MRFEIREICVPPGGERSYVLAEWRDALVVVDDGAIEIEFLDGRRWRFARGEVLFLTGLHLRALRNPGKVPAVLLAIQRQHGVPRNTLRWPRVAHRQAHSSCRCRSCGMARRC